MKVAFRTVQGKTFHLELEPTTKVSDVKAQIEEVQGPDFPRESTNVIYQGKILKDGDTLEQSSMSENGFCVIIAMKKRPAPAPKPEAAPAPAPAEAAAPEAEAPPAEAPPAAAAAAAPEAAPAPAAAAPADAYGSAASQLATGSELESILQQITEMGFPRDKAMHAMRVAYNNPDRAMEYLMTGFPPGMDFQPQQAAPAGGAPGQQAVPAAAPADQPFNMFQPGNANAAAGQVEGGGAPGADPLHELRHNMQFQALRGLVQQNPALLQPMLQELGKSNPQMFALINENQQEFLAMINEPIANDEEMQTALASIQAGLEAEQAAQGEGGMVQEIELTQEEVEAIERLGALGFPRDACIEAFLICDKNEEAAANYLLENAGDLM